MSVCDVDAAKNCNSDDDFENVMKDVKTKKGLLKIGWRVGNFKT